MVLKEFLILIVVNFKVAFADSEHFKDDQPTCHLQTISCPCERRLGAEPLNVTMHKCVGNERNVCNRKAVITKCRTAYLSHKRQPRDTGSQTRNCQNGKILPADSSPSIKTPPNVTINGILRNVWIDQDVKFRCKVVSNLAANVTWLFNGLPLAEQMEHRHSYLDCNTVLHIERVMTKDTGNYTCVVQNEIGRAMASSHLTVTRKRNGPYIRYMELDGKPGSNTAVIGSSLNVTCESQDVQTLNKFRKDGKTVCEGDESHYQIYHISKKELNAKVSKLEIKNVTFEDTGNYTCVVWLRGFITTKTFYLRIVNASQSCRRGYYCPPGSQQPLKCPAGTYQPSTRALSKSDCIPCPWGSYQPLAGAATCEQCENRNFSKKPDYFIRPAVNVTDCPPGYHPTAGPSSGKEKAYLSHKRQRRDTGSKTLYCHNDTIQPAVSSPAIKTPPKVTINGVSRNVWIDQDVQFRCTVVSNLAANVTWLFNGLPLADQMVHRHSYLNCKMVLHIERVMTKDTGNYTCVVQNEIGRAMASSHLVVTRKQNGPFIRSMGLEGKTGSNTAVVGSSLNLTCESQDVKVINFFKKDGIKVREGDASHYEMYHISKKESNAKVSKLEIKNATFEDTGNYTCVAWLKGFITTKTFYLRIVNASQSPRVYRPTGDSSSEKEQQSSIAGHITSVEIIGIVFGILGAVVITLLVTICIARKWQWLSSYKTRNTSSNQHDLESLPSEMLLAHSELNGLCGDTSNVQHSQVVRRPPEKDYEAKYDVFICYSSKDLSWVKELLAELEKRGFVCCIDFKDFTVGAAIVENITQAIYCSRKTVAVLTPDFVESEWCSHELQKALTRIRSHQVVPIVYKNCTVPLLLQDRTYLDWENCHVKPYFWEQLERALRLPNDVEIRFDEPIGANPADQLVS